MNEITVGNLQSLDLDALRPIFPEADQARDAAVGLDEEQVFRRSGPHTFQDGRGAVHAAETLARLPEPFESIHIILRGTFRNWDFVPAILKLAEPAVCTALTLTTLGYDKETADGLLALLDAGQVGTCSLLASVYFQAHEVQLWGWLSGELHRRGCRALAARNHCKLMLFAMDDGRHYVMESSANLRSCRMAETATLTNDEGLYQFHVQWTDELFRRART